MALKSTRRVKGHVEKLRKELATAATKAEKQRKALQDTLNRVLSSAKETLVSLGKTRERIAKLIRGDGRSASSARKAVKQVRKAAKSAQRRVSKAARSARSTAKKVRTQARRRVKSAQKSAQKSVRTVQKRVQASLPGPVQRAMSRAAMATSKAKATVVAPPAEPTPAPESSPAPSAIPGGPTP